MKNMINPKQEKEQNDGITLITLVITIIVLLILAGISITTLTSNNGILTKTIQAQEKTQIAEIKESVQTDILAKQIEEKGKNISKTQLKIILEQYFQDVPESLPDNIDNLELVAKEEYGGHKIKIADIWNGEFGKEKPKPFDPNTLEIGEEAKNNDKYGWKVGKYTVQTPEMSTNVWRLFYQDTNYTYIITDECIGKYRPSTYYTTMKNEKGELKYQTGADVDIVGKKLNSIISSLFVKDNEDGRIRTVAWLTDTSDTGMWKNYKNSDAVFAIRKSYSGIICGFL